MNADTLKELLANAEQGPWSFVPWHIEEDMAAVRATDGHLICTASSDNTAHLISLAPQLAADNIALQAEVERWRSNSIDTWSAMNAMRNSINEHVPIPSIEGDLLQGPDNSVFCASVAEAVIGRVTKLEAENARLRRVLTTITKDAQAVAKAGKRTNADWSRLRASMLMARTALNSDPNTAAALPG